MKKRGRPKKRELSFEEMKEKIDNGEKLTAEEMKTFFRLRKASYETPDHGNKSIPEQLRDMGQVLLDALLEAALTETGIARLSAIRELRDWRDKEGAVKTDGEIEICQFEAPGFDDTKEESA